MQNAPEDIQQILSGLQIDCANGSSSTVPVTVHVHYINVEFACLFLVIFVVAMFLVRKRIIQGPGAYFVVPFLPLYS